MGILFQFHELTNQAKGLMMVSMSFKDSLLRNSIHRDVAQPGSALVWGTRGRRFKSCHPDFDFIN